MTMKEAFTFFILLEKVFGVVSQKLEEYFQYFSHFATYLSNFLMIFSY